VTAAGRPVTPVTLARPALVTLARQAPATLATAAVTELIMRRRWWQGSVLLRGA